MIAIVWINDTNSIVTFLTTRAINARAIIDSLTLSILACFILIAHFWNSTTWLIIVEFNKGPFTTFTSNIKVEVLSIKSDCTNCICRRHDIVNNRASNLIWTNKRTIVSQNFGLRNATEVIIFLITHIILACLSIRANYISASYWFALTILTFLISEAVIILIAFWWDLKALA